MANAGNARRQSGCVFTLWHEGYPGSVDAGRLTSGGTVQAHGMMCDILVQIRQHQQQIQHPLALLGNGITHFLLQILDNEKRVRQQPFQFGGGQGALFTAARKGVIGADERLVEKMIKAELLARKRSGDRVCTRALSAMSQDARIHGHTPIASKILIIEARGAERITVFPCVRKYPGRCGIENVTVKSRRGS